MKISKKSFEFLGVYYSTKAEALKVAKAYVKSSVRNIVASVLEVTESVFDIEDREEKKMLSDEWRVSDEIKITKY